jgi:hypothetical protein
MMQLSFSLHWVIVLIVSKQIAVVSLTYSVGTLSCPVFVLLVRCSVLGSVSGAVVG